MMVSNQFSKSELVPAWHIWCDTCLSEMRYICFVFVLHLLRTILAKPLPEAAKLLTVFPHKSHLQQRQPGDRIPTIKSAIVPVSTIQKYKADLSGPSTLYPLRHVYESLSVVSTEILKTLQGLLRF